MGQSPYVGIEQTIFALHGIISLLQNVTMTIWHYGINGHVVTTTVFDYFRTPLQITSALGLLYFN